jgi:hypothetical protein
MSGKALQCAYCGEVLRLDVYGVNAWRVDNKFACNEFCADGVLPIDGDAAEDVIAAIGQSARAPTGASRT